MNNNAPKIDKEEDKYYLMEDKEDGIQTLKTRINSMK